MSKEIVLPFGGARFVEPGIVELFIHAGVELDAGQLLELYQACAELAGQPYGLLVNRGTDYSMTVGALEKLGNHPALRAVALFIHGVARRDVAQYQKAIYGVRTPVEIFSEREDALAWLREVMRTAG
jgi:hypothetical protein